MYYHIYNTAVALILLCLVGCVCYCIRDIFDHDMSGAFWCVAVFIILSIMSDDILNLIMSVTQFFY